MEKRTPFLALIIFLVLNLHAADLPIFDAPVDTPLKIVLQL